VSSPMRNGSPTEARQKPKTKGRKNISIGFAVWSRLRTHGIYGDSLDDILNRLMDKADELDHHVTPSKSKQKKEPLAISKLATDQDKIPWSGWERQGYASSTKVVYPLTKEPLDSYWHKLKGRRVVSKYDESLGEDMGEVKGISFSFVEVEDPSGIKKYIIPKNLFVSFDEYYVYIPVSREELKSKYSDTNENLKSEYIKERDLPPIPPASSESESPAKVAFKPDMSRK
jgi:hypothetical protein